MDRETMCAENTRKPYFDSLYDLDRLNRGLEGAIGVYERIAKNMTDDSITNCRKFARNKIAVVQFKLLSDTVTKIVRSRRVTFTGQIANIGKTNKNVGLSIFIIFYFIQEERWDCSPESAS